MIVACPECGRPLGANAVEGLCPECLMRVGAGSRPGNADQQAGRLPGQPPPGINELAPHFPHLEILGLLGTGGMGAVYQAKQRELDRFVALKILFAKTGHDPAFAERFAREARALARLNHPNIVVVHDFGTAGPFWFFVMEFVEGINLRQMLRAQRLSPHEALAIVPQICNALQYAHDQGVVHRDIKPENLLIDRQGRVKIADFGLAKLLGKGPLMEPLTRSAEIMGTPQYMAPEQLEKPLEVDHRADIFSLGVVFYEMLTGELPMGRFAPPSRKVQVDVRLDEIVLRALEKEPERRYQYASQVKSDLETVTAGSPGKRKILRNKQLLLRTVAAGSFFLSVAVFSWFLLDAQRKAAGPAATRELPRAPAIPEETPPVVVETIPPSGASEIDPSLSELRVIFSQTMQDQSWSWRPWTAEAGPTMAGQAHYLEDHRTCVFPVKLDPGKVYAIWLNNENLHDFKGHNQQPAVPYLLIFETRK